MNDFKGKKNFSVSTNRQTKRHWRTRKKKQAFSSIMLCQLAILKMYSCTREIPTTTWQEIPFFSLKGLIIIVRLLICTKLFSFRHQPSKFSVKFSISTQNRWSVCTYVRENILLISFSCYFCHTFPQRKM